MKEDIYIQYLDNSGKTIISYFAGPQDPTVYTNQCVVSISDPVWVEYFNSQPGEIQKMLPNPIQD